MRVIECDRCHKRINKDARKTGYINLNQRDIKTGELEGNREFDDWDLCDDCMQKIRDFVRMMPTKESSKVPDGFEIVDVKPKVSIKRRVPVPVQGTTITKPDWIRRLAGEGKTIKEICEITGCSEPTARKYKAEVMNEETEPIAEGNQED